MARVYLLVAFGLIIFRAQTIDDIYIILQRILLNQDFHAIRYGTMGRWYFLYTMLLMLLVVFKDFKDVFLPSKIKLFDNPNRIVRWASYYIICALIIWYGINSSADGSFIYFNF
jgi:hypothetical protein